jgi:16S rRNA (cytosine1402-N4)-methyltransferase
MTSGRGDENDLAAGGPARHVPVLREDVMRIIAPCEGGLYLDATFGAGGYTAALLAPVTARVLALDRDPAAVQAGSRLVRESNGRLLLVQERFSKLAEAARRLGLSDFDAVVLDIGLSSMQIDEARRGFSFRAEGPLDMRMESEGESAADLVNNAEEETLADILYYFGEERASRRIARAIVMDRAKAPFLTTAALAGMIARVAPAKPGEIHAATRTFQALRIAVNDELGELVRALAAAESVLKPGGRLVVVTFHSLEDRIVKQFFAARSGRGEAVSRQLPGEAARPQPTFALQGKQPVLPSAQEIRANPRARSAKLRHGVRTSAASRGLDEKIMALARLPHRDLKGRRHGANS